MSSIKALNIVTAIISLKDINKLQKHLQKYIFINVQLIINSIKTITKTMTTKDILTLQKYKHPNVPSK